MSTPIPPAALCSALCLLLFASTRPVHPTASNACSILQLFVPAPPAPATDRHRLQCALPPAFAPARIRLLYDVNPQEGFNLRRDVFMRLAVFVRHVRRTGGPGWADIKLVLPPFRHLPHWAMEDDSDAGSHGTPHFWNEFFDLDSMRAYAPVLDAWQYYDELHASDKRSPLPGVHCVELGNYDFADGRFSDRFELAPDDGDVGQLAAHMRRRLPLLLGERNYTVASLRTARFQGTVSSLRPLLHELWARLPEGTQPIGGQFSVLVRNAEIVLHDRFGDAEYWRARRSMRFAGRLEAEAASFRRDVMRMPVAADEVQRPARWQEEKPFRAARGAPYVCAHLRRGDFLVAGRVEQMPTLRLAAEQISLVLKLRGLRDVFVASDCNGFEFNDLKSLLPRIRVHRYRPARRTANRLSAGAVAIVDQIVCSRAAHFVGTLESTFTYRIQEEREIMGFAPETTFNTFCGRRAMAQGGGAKCEKNARWLIEYDDFEQ